MTVKNHATQVKNIYAITAFTDERSIYVCSEIHVAL